MKAIRFSLLFLLLCGLLYPLATTGLAQLLFPYQARGSLIQDPANRVVGSALIGQEFTRADLFQGRAGTGANQRSLSGGASLSPSDPKLQERVRADLAAWEAQNPGQPAPIELLTASASGVDPHITPEAALAQVPRISRERGIPEAELRALVQTYTEGRSLGLFGEPRVNVLKLNLALSAR